MAKARKALRRLLAFAFLVLVAGLLVGEAPSAQRAARNRTSTQPSAEAVAEARKTLADYQATTLKRAELMLWLDNDPQTRTALPFWRRDKKLPSFGNTTVASRESMARLAAMLLLGYDVDRFFWRELDAHVDAFAKSPEPVLREDGSLYAIAEVVDALMRSTQVPDNRTRARTLVNTVFKDKQEPDDVAVLRFYSIAKRHDLMPAGATIKAKRLEKTLREQCDLMRKKLQNPKVSIDALSWHGMTALIASYVEFASVFELPKLLQDCESVVTALESKRAQFAKETSALHYASFAHLFATAFNGPKPPLDDSLLSGEASILDAMLLPDGLDFAMHLMLAEEKGNSTFDPALEPKIAMRSALLTAITLSGGLLSEEKISASKELAELGSGEKRAALRVLLASSVDHSVDPAWEQFRIRQRAYYLGQVDELVKTIEGTEVAGENLRRRDPAGIFYPLADCAGVLLALQSLDVEPSDKGYKKLYDAFIDALRASVDSGNHNVATYCYSLCLLALQQHAQKLAEAGVSAKDAKKSKPRSGGDDRDAPVKEIPDKADMRRALTKQELELAEDMASIVLAAHGTYGFGYGPSRPWVKASKSAVQGKKKIVEGGNADNSNSQFAMIGLKAAMVLGVTVPDVYLKHEIDRLLAEMIETSNVAVKVRADGSDYFGAVKDSAKKEDEELAKRSRVKPAETAAPILVKPAGIDYSPAYGKENRRAGQGRSVRATVSSGVISSLLVAREALKERKALDKKIDQKIRYAVLQVKVYYAGHPDLKEPGALSGQVRNGYGIFGILRASVTDGQPTILGRDWRAEGIDYWLSNADFERGSWAAVGYGESLCFQGLVTLALNGLALPIKTLAEDIAEEGDAPPPTRPPAKSAGD